MASSVDLPQPDGPAMDTYSPFAISMWMPASACVSTSSVTKTLVTASRCIRGVDPFVIFTPSSVLSPGSIQPDAIMAVPGRHIRQNHLVSYLQSVQHLDGIYRTAPQFDETPRGALTIGISLEQTHNTVRLAEHGPADVDHIAQILQLDGSIHTQVRHRARRQSADQPDVNNPGAIDDGRVKAADFSRDDTIARVHLSILPEGDVLGLCLRDFQLGFESPGLCGFRQSRARRNSLAHLHQQFRNNAVDTGADFERFDLAFLQLEHGTKLVDFSSLRRELSLHGFVSDG